MAELVTTGMGQVERIADRADLSLSWVGRGRDRTAAVRELTERIKNVEPRLDQQGVRVLSRRLSVHDRWDGKRRNGAEASQSYQVRITDVAVLDDLLAALIEAEPAVLDGPHWTLEDDTEATREAQQAAVAEARAKAEGYAEAVGGRLGVLRMVTDGSGPGRVVRASSMMYHSAMESSALNVPALSLEPQPVTVSAHCTITWELLV
jgi:hypothetical protein